MNPKQKKRIYTLTMLAVCFLLMLVAALVRDGRVLGHQVRGGSDKETVKRGDTGAVEINTAELAPDAIGYAGPTPVTITIEDGRIAAITPAANSETPSFFRRATDNVLPQYIGMDAETAMTAEVDACTGATLSSNALRANVRAGMRAYLDRPAEKAPRQSPVNHEWVAALVVALAAMILPLVWRNKTYRLVQLALNAGVLGFWTGTFLSYGAMLGFMANGLTLGAMLTSLLMLIAAFVYPLIGRPNHYCMWMCPLGSLQELAGRCSRRKLKIGGRTLEVLTWVRRGLWFALMVCLWTGVWFAWTDYELFAAFVVNNAAWYLLTAAAVVVALSVVVNRPYCRFVCPTGTLFRLCQPGAVGQKRKK